MRKHFKYLIIGLVLVAFGVTGCDDDDVSATISPADYPVATFTTDFVGDVIPENGSITYTITIDKPIEYDLHFSIKYDGTVDEDDFEELEDAVIPAYSTSTDISINFLYDGVSEEEETMSIEIGEFNLGTRYFLNPSTVNLKQELKVANLVNDPSLLSIQFDWSNSEDIDIVTWSATDPMEGWGDGGATGAQPEMDESLLLSDPVGTYYVNIMHWGGPTFDYTFTIAHPDQTEQVITGTFDADNLDQYTNDIWTDWGDPYDSYRVLKVENDGTKFTVTKL